MFKGKRGDAINLKQVISRNIQDYIKLAKSGICDLSSGIEADVAIGGGTPTLH